MLTAYAPRETDADRRQREYDAAVAEGERNREAAVNHEWRMRLAEQQRRQEAEDHLSAIEAAHRAWWDLTLAEINPRATAEELKARAARIEKAYYAMLSAIQYRPRTWETWARWSDERRGTTPEGVWENEGGALALDDGTPF